MDILLWLFILEILGIIGMPASFYFLNQAFDKGIVSAKIIGLLIFAFVIWTIGYLEVFLIDKSLGITVLIILLIAALLIIQAKRKSFQLLIRESYKNILICEFLFISVFLSFALIKSMNSQIDHTEQPMDFAFLNSVFYAISYPPLDPWYSGYTIQYYYLGYVIFAWPAKLVGIQPEISYNLALISIPALSASITFSIISTLSIMLGIKRKLTILLSFLGVIIQNLFGNMEGILEIIRAWGFGSVNFWKSFNIKGFEAPILEGSLLPNQHWWWWKASRVIDTIHFGKSLDYTIQEFPFFSFFLGDLHPHFMSIPFMLLFLALFINFLIPARNHTIRYIKIFNISFIGIVVGAIGFINTWNLPTFIVLGSLMLIIHGFNYQKLDAHILRNTLFFLFIYIISIFLPFADFYSQSITHSFKISPYLGAGTSGLHFIIVWGFFLIALLPTIFLRFPIKKTSYLIKLFTISIILSLLPIVFWIFITHEVGPLLLRFQSSNLAVILLILITLPVGIVNAIHHNFKQSTPYGIVLLFSIIGMLLIFGVEFFFILGPFGSRMNTIFKIYYQIWILFSICSPIAIYLTLKHLNLFQPKTSLLRWAYPSLLAITFIFGISYPTAVLITTSQNTFSLNGLSQLKATNPEEYEAIKWLISARNPEDVILEAWGQDYTEYSRFSAFTGIPTIIGWTGHELQWRRDTIEHQSRLEHVDRIYLGKNKNESNELIQKYKIKYIIFSNREKSKYNLKNLGHLDGSIELVFSQNNTQIYKTRILEAKEVKFAN